MRFATIAAFRARSDAPARRRWDPARWGRLARLALGIAAGLLMALSMPPRAWWVLFPLAVAMLAVAVHGSSWRTRLLIGAVAGAAYLGPGMFWLTLFSTVGYVGALIVEVAIFTAAIVLVPGGRGGWWALPGMLVLLEAVRSRFPFGGFPLPALGLGQVDGPFAVAAGLGGELLVTGVAALAGIVLAAPLLARRRVLGAMIAAVAVAVVLGAAMLPSPRAAGSLDVAIVQGGGPRGIPAVRSDPDLPTERQFAASSAIPGSPQLVLWPEDVVTVDAPVRRTLVGQRLAALARRLDTTLVVGVVRDVGNGFYNLAVAWGPNGRITGRYDKVHRVPFGEYIPFRGLVDRLSRKTALVPRDAIPGHGPGLLRTKAGRLGVVLSYEVFFSDRARAAVNAGGEVLLVPTNAASYTTETVPAMEVAAARLRARELGRTVLQAAPTGYSAVILPGGTVIRQSKLGEPDVLTARIPLERGRTPYTRTGDWPVVSLSVLVLLAGTVRRRDSLGNTG